MASGALLGIGVAGFGAQVMYYGGDVIEVALTALLCREWLAAVRRPKLALSTAHQR